MYDGDVTEDDGVGERMTIHEAGVVVTIDEEQQKGPCYLAEIAMSQYLSPSRPKKKKKDEAKVGLERNKKRK